MIHAIIEYILVPFSFEDLYLNMQLNDMADWKIINVQIEGEYQLMDDTFSMKGTNSDVMIPFESHIERVRELINKVEEGKEIKDSELKGLTH